MGKEKSSSTTTKTKKKSSKKKEEKRVIAGQYSVGNVIGRGGYGVVYKAMNENTGEFVAVKKISLKNCSKDQIDTIHSEINLLKKLSHKHIVRYVDHKQTKNKLYIIMEFIENGSLQDIVKNYGKLKENVCALYTAQVLEGLKFLHSEGVMHRDIKGANILTTRDRVVKLADFGVASTLQDVESENPVGTPYWMAPEIIELNPATPASDIWSVGCTVIELLTGEPPYFHLDAMPALYRIVQDDHPPLPADISPACKDFLLACFQKDPNLRKPADKLINHQWIKGGRKFGEAGEPEPTAVPATTVAPAPAQELVVPAPAPAITPRFSAAFEPAKSENRASTRVNRESVLLAPNAVALLDKFKEKDDDDDWGAPSTGKREEPLDFSFEIPEVQVERNETQEAIQDVVMGQLMNRETKPTKILDDDDMDFGEGDFALNLEDFGGNEEDEPFGQDLIEEAFDDIEMEFTVSKRDEELKIENDVSILINKLNPKESEASIVVACASVLVLFRDFAHLKERICQKLGALPFLEILSINNNKIISAVFDVIAEVIRDNRVFQETLCLAGALPAIIKFADPKYPTQVRQKVAHFIREVIHSSPLTLQMFVACQGLPVLVVFLDHDSNNYEDRREILLSAVDDIWEIFSVPSANIFKTISKKDFCKLFTSAKLMHNLSKLLLSTIKDKTPEGQDTLVKVIALLTLFSNTEKDVKAHMAEEVVLQRMLDAIDQLDSENKLNLLKIIKTLAHEEAAHESYEKIAFPKIVSLLGSGNEGYVNQALQALFGICRGFKQRLEKAIKAGCIPYLKDVLLGDNPLKNLAIRLLIDAFQCGKEGRQALWDNKGVELYVKILDIDTWQEKAMTALANWLKEEKRVEDELVKPAIISKIIKVLGMVSPSILNRVTQPLFTILQQSVKVNKVLGESKEIIPVLAHALTQKHKDPLALLTIIKICRSLYKYTDKPKLFMTDIYPIIKQFAQGSTSFNLVQQSAKEFVEICDTNLQI